MSDDYKELMVEPQKGVDLKQLQQRLGCGDDVTVQEGRKHLVLLGKVSDLRTAIPSLTGQESDEVAIPQTLRDVVKAISVVPPLSTR